MFSDEGAISNYLRFNIKKNSYGKFELSQLHLVDKIINHVGLEVSVNLKSREMSAGKPLHHKYESSLGRKFVWNYRSAVCMFSYLEVSTRIEI